MAATDLEPSARAGGALATAVVLILQDRVGKLMPERRLQRGRHRYDLVPADSVDHRLVVIEIPDDEVFEKRPRQVEHVIWSDVRDQGRVVGCELELIRPVGVTWEDCARRIPVRDRFRTTSAGERPSTGLSRNPRRHGGRGTAYKSRVAVLPTDSAERPAAEPPEPDDRRRPEWARTRAGAAGVSRITP